MNQFALRQTVLALAAGITVAGGCQACVTAKSAAEAEYRTALLRCVDDAATLQQSRDCRRHVDEDYGVTVTSRDGGGQ